LLSVPLNDSIILLSCYREVNNYLKFFFVKQLLRLLQLYIVM